MNEIVCKDEKFVFDEELSYFDDDDDEVIIVEDDEEKKKERKYLNCVKKVLKDDDEINLFIRMKVESKLIKDLKENLMKDCIYKKLMIRKDEYDKEMKEIDDEFENVNEKIISERNDLIKLKELKVKMNLKRCKMIVDLWYYVMFGHMYGLTIQEYGDLWIFLNSELKKLRPKMKYDQKKIKEKIHFILKELKFEIF